MGLDWSTPTRVGTTERAFWTSRWRAVRPQAAPQAAPRARASRSDGGGGW